MNLWKCEKCDATALGVGGAMGLSAIGWYFRRGPLVLCPIHHPFGFSGAELQAERLQKVLVAESLRPMGGEEA